VSVSAAGWQTDKTPYHRITPDDSFHKGASPLLNENWQMSDGKILNGGPSCGAAEAPRATPFGLARLPCILRSETYQKHVHLGGPKQSDSQDLLFSSLLNTVTKFLTRIPT